MNNGQFLKAQAAKAGIPLRTLADVTADLAHAKTREADKEMARLMLRHGRLTPDALQYVIAYADHVWLCESYGIKR